VAAAYEAMAFHRAAQGAVAVSSLGNRWLAEVAPWTALKKASHMRICACTTVHSKCLFPTSLSSQKLGYLVSHSVFDGHRQADHQHGWATDSD